MLLFKSNCVRCRLFLPIPIITIVSIHNGIEYTRAHAAHTLTRTQSADVRRNEQIFFSFLVDTPKES